MSQTPTQPLPREYYQEIASKISWEGGVSGFVAYGYSGLRDSHLTSLLDNVAESIAAVEAFFEERGIELLEY